MTVARRISGQSPWSWAGVVARVAYGSAVGLAGILSALLLVVVAGPRVENGERWQGLVIGWSLGVPAALLCSAVSAVAVYGAYRSARSSLWAGVVFLSNVTLIAGLEVFCAAWVAGFLAFAS